MKSKLFVLLLIIIPLLTSCDKNELLSIHIIDVGQGDSILITTPKNRNILIDAGNEDSQNIIYTYLKKNKIKSIDFAIATHPDSDHIGSFDYIIENFNVKSFYMPKKSSDSISYKNLLNSCKKNNISIDYLNSDDQINIEDDIYMYVLSPNYVHDSNNLNSLVFNLSYMQKSFLFTGDAEAQNEQDIIDSYSLKNIDFLKVAHHGSNTSSSIDFLSIINPDISVISCGYKNSYGHPHKSTLNNLSKINSKVFRTDLLGDIVFYSDGKKIFTKKKYNIENYLNVSFLPFKEHYNNIYIA